MPGSIPIDSTPLGVKHPREATLDRFVACFKDLEDPRSGNAALHDFHALLLIASCAVLCGARGALDMALFAKARSHSRVNFPT
ncbi:MAG: transposase family protein [Acetobacteraceae bacterium]|nr:transposase family protein [Acetobacteraceae bacterium]